MFEPQKLQYFFNSLVIKDNLLYILLLDTIEISIHIILELFLFFRHSYFHTYIHYDLILLTILL